MNFNELNVIEPILLALDELKYVEASPIQEKTIPLALEGNDILGCAQTGSGKTAAFAIPILQLLMKAREVKTSAEAKEQNEIVSKKDAAQESCIGALILTPTRELALQISEQTKKIAKHLNIETYAIFGGVDQNAQIEMLEQGIDILVATPGRLLDLINQGYITLKHVKILVLDEADRMLDMGFIKEIKTIVRQIPKKQTLMFSATMPKPIERLADTILHQPKTIMVDQVSSTVESIEQYVYYVDASNKLALLTSLMRGDDVKNAIVFTNTRQTADVVMKHLLKNAVRTLAIHGDKSQNARQDALIQFKNGKIKVLVATDVAARGIDISKLSHVVNYDIPESPESYIHRIGRTGRAGLDGTAINFCCIDEKEDLEYIENHIGKKMTELKSEWPMKIFQKTVVVNKKAKNTEEVIEVAKVKDISLSGKPINTKNKGRFHKEKFGYQKDKPSFGKQKDKTSFGKQKEKPSFGKQKNKPSTVKQGNKKSVK